MDGLDATTPTAKGTPIQVGDSTLSGSATGTVNGAAAHMLLSNISAGDDSVNREGAKITIEKIILKYQYRKNATNATCTFRAQLILDRAPRGATNFTTNVAAIYDVNSEWASFNKDGTNKLGRFQVLWGENWTLPVESLGSGIRTAVINRKFPITYSDIAGEYGDHVTNALFLVVWYGRQGSTDVPTMYFKSRVYFSDI